MINLIKLFFCIAHIFDSAFCLKKKKNLCTNEENFELFQFIYEKLSENISTAVRRRE